jgi:solute:Na+ symporter, SSS family
VQVQTGRAFVVLLTIVAYAIALRVPQSIFDLASQFAFAGYAALSPLLIAALCWRGSTKWGALASTLWAGGAIAAIAIIQTMIPPPAGAPVVVWSLGETDVILRGAAGVTVLGFLPVVPMTIVSALLMWAVSLATRKPSTDTIARYFRTV